jgi:hypothetical protein
MDYPFDDEDTSVTTEPSDFDAGESQVDADDTVEVDPTVSDVESDVAPEVDEPVAFEIDGTPITLTEAQRGYLRQADYTRKTQELAAQRERVSAFDALTSALARDPQGTLQVLAQQYNVPLGNPTPPPPIDDDPYAMYEDVGGGSSGPREVVDPVARQFIEQQQQAAAHAQIERELTQLRQVDPSLDETSVLRHALEGGYPSLRAAWSDLNFDRIASPASANQPDPERQAAARQAAATTHRASAARTGRPAEKALPPDAGIRELLKFTARQAGVTDLTTTLV